MKIKVFVLGILLLALGMFTGCSAARLLDRLFPRTVKQENVIDVNLVELLSGITDTVFVEGFGFLEYELYAVPVGGSDEFFAFITWIYIPMLEAARKYFFNFDYALWNENNTALSYNVREMMYRHQRNLSITRLSNPDGSVDFIFNAHTYEGNFELYQIRAFRR